jgi:hypothetical protein
VKILIGGLIGGSYGLLMDLLGYSFLTSQFWVGFIFVAVLIVVINANI